MWEIKWGKILVNEVIHESAYVLGVVNPYAEKISKICLAGICWSQESKQKTLIFSLWSLSNPILRELKIR